MSIDNVRPEINLLSAFTLTIAGALVAGLPMAVAIIWVCSKTCFPPLRAADIQAACPTTASTAPVPDRSGRSYSR